MANLALCARTAHQGGLVGNTTEFSYPERFSRGKRIGRPFLVTLLGCSKRVTRQRGETRNVKIQISRKCQTTKPYKNTNNHKRHNPINFLKD